MATDASSTYLNLSSLVTKNDSPYLKQYINYLNHYAHGGKPTTNFKKSEIEAAHKILLDKKIITAGKFTENAPLQLDQLVKYVDNEGQKNTNAESVAARSNYDLYSKYYLEADKIEKDFNIQNSKEKPTESLSKHVEKDKNNQYQFITAEGMLKQFNKVKKGFSNIYGINVNPVFPPAKLLQQYYDGKIKPIPIKKQINAGVSSTTGIVVPAEVTDHYEIIDPKTNLKYNISPFLDYYGTKENVDAKRKEYEEDKGLRFDKFASSQGELGGKNWVMSKTLTYRNDNTDIIQDKSATIALAAIDENKGNVIKGSGGIIKPVNFKKLADDSYETEMTEILGMLFNNQDALNNSLTNTHLKYQGSDNASSSVKLEFNLKKLQDNLFLEEKGAKTQRLKKAITILASNGLEFNIKKDTFRQFAKDNYMQSSVTEGLLRGNGLTATDYEKNNFYYDYKLTLGSNDKMILTYKIQSYDYELEKIKDEEEVVLEYPKEVGIDNILKDVREVGIANGININKFLKAKTEKEQRKKELEEKQKQVNNAPYTQQPGETLENFKKRMELEGKKRYKG